jgi:hypothetical protein
LKAQIDEFIKEISAELVCWCRQTGFIVARAKEDQTTAALGL